MIPDWRTILHPLEVGGFLTVAGACLLYAFILHLKMRALAKSAGEQRENLESRIALANEAIEKLRSQVEQTAQESPVPVLPAGGALNLNRRGQVLRMRRRGESPEPSSGALGIARNEVDLLLKVHEMALDHVAQG
ncbi:MAG: hypothetical protein HYX25_00880 [Candidatus Solibacter usitatus]|nr:hypothetical protein [Candidatus Solibacter usitatus]